MDQQRFDAALKALHTGTSRRRGLAAALGVLLGGMSLDAAALGRNDPGREGPCGDGSASDNRCKKHGDCCTKYCDDGHCRCKPNWMDCTKNAHCCSGSCLSGRCDGGMKPARSRCEVDFNCETGLACIKGTCQASKTASCSKRNCTGCCAGTTCRIGLAKSACGKKGGACASCGANGTCNEGVCGAGCTAASCPNGCCQNGTCKPGTSDSACGTGGAACAACGNGTTCNAGVCGAPGPTYTNTSSPGAAKSAAVSADGLTIRGVDFASFKEWTRTSLTETTWTPTDLASDFNTFYNTDDLAVSPDALTALFPSVSTDNVLVWGRDNTSSPWTSRSTFGSVTQFSDPTSIAISGDGLTALVTKDKDTGGSNGSAAYVSMWTRADADPDTTWTRQSAFGGVGNGDGQFGGETMGVAMTPDGLTALVSDWGNQRISVFTRPDAQPATTWTFQSHFGSAGSAPNQFDWPTGVAVSSDGLTAWIADTKNNRISVWLRPNAASTVWSNGSTFSTLDDSTQLTAPRWVSATPDGKTVVVIDNGPTYRMTVWKQD